MEIKKLEKLLLFRALQVCMTTIEQSMFFCCKKYDFNIKKACKLNIYSLFCGNY